MISHHTQMLSAIRSGEPELSGVKPQMPQKVYVTKSQGITKRGVRR